ncbi:F-box/WD repeat-containing protein 7-like isoform X2 [Mya arenaria]|uniref:F-box/WD repeat-containing protein 7-like isoform X2 n=1 Tax=Mya arenaria TaxID=6604 RepID=UPI0022E779A6|nr:F-box/WD repeat-containing protein 7-like isoform X2 [Mya arenaria]
MGSRRLDINTATLEDFEQLIGVGHLKAKAIIKYRKVRGGFQTVSDLGGVPKVGQSVLDLNRSKLCCKASCRTSRAIRGRNGGPSSGKASSSKSSNSGLGLKRIQGFKHPRQASILRKGRTSVASKKSPSEKISETDNDPSSDKNKSHNCANLIQDGPSTSSNSAGSLVSISKPFQGPSSSPEYSSNSVELEEEEEEEEVENGEEQKSIQGELTNNNSDLDRDDIDEEEDTKSEVSDSVYSLLSPRSRIPVPVNSTLSQHLKRKGSLYRDDFFSPSGKRLCHPQFSSPHTTYGNLKGPLKKCVQRFQRQRIPSKEHPPPGLAEWLKQFQDWGNAERLMAVDELISLCEPTQVRHMMQVIEPQFQRDFISLLPKELALYVLSFLDPRDLLQAAQTCRYWRVLTEDNLLWREKCREESIDEPLVFGSNRLRRRQPSPKSPWKSLYMRQHQIEQNWRTGQLRPPKLLKGHDDHVITCLEFFGSRVVSGSDDNTLKVWSALTGKCLRTLVGHTGGVWSSQMQGNIIISGSTDRTLKVWNADTGQCMHTLYGHTSTVRCMHLCGTKVVSGSRDATLRVWNVETGQCLHVLMGHVAAVRCVQYDGRRVVSGAYDYMVKVWDPETETCLHTLQGHTNRVYSLQFDGVHIVSGSLDTSIRVWDVETGNCLHTLIGHQSLTSGLELKDNILVSGNADSTVKVWDITTGQCLQTLQGSNKHQSAVTCLQFNKKFVITSSDDGTVKIWDLKSGDFLRNLVTLDSGGSGGVVWRVRCSNTKLVCAVGSRNGTEETKLLVLDFDVEERKDKMPMIERM